MTRFRNTVRKLGPSEDGRFSAGVFLLLALLVFGGVMVEEAYAMAPGGDGGQGGGVQMLIFFGLIIAVFYFLIMRPQMKRQKEHKTMLSTLRKGDKVVTNSGMYGTIVGMDDKENKVVLKVAENVKIEFLKSSIAGRVGAE
jgi:preprotein translocase subunit YajC